MPITPTRTLHVQFVSGSAVASWTFDDGTGDPWIGNPYQWNATLSITTPQQTSDHATIPQFFFDGTNVLVGDWVATAAGGMALQIISISAQSSSLVTCVVEDTDRYNTFADPTQNGNGLIQNGDGILFGLADDGIPILSPVVTLILPYEFQIDLISRFRARNQRRSFVEIDQPGNTFVVGDALYLDSTNTYNLVDFLHPDRTIGYVNSIGVPGPGYFTYRPLGTIVYNISPALPGTIGGLIYLNSALAGKYTATAPANNARAIFIQLNSAGTTGIQIEHGTVSPSSQTKSILFTPTLNQTIFTLPTEARVIIAMSINGIESTNFSYAQPTLTFDPVASGYGVDPNDEVFFVYTT